MEQIEVLGKRAKEAAQELAALDTYKKNRALNFVADALEFCEEEILESNEMDLEHGRKNGMSKAMLDRLALTSERIKNMAEGIRQMVQLEDPIGEVISMKKKENGLMIGQKRVPLGVIGIIYESRPNVTADAFALCFKAGNAVILRGGKDAIHSNRAILEVIQGALAECNVNKNAIQLVTDTSHEVANQMMKMNEYLDVLIPRGGANLIKTVVQNSTVPVIETGTGNCHIYVDEFADLAMAIPIILNAKTQRLGTCNTCESLVVHSAVADAYLPAIADALMEKGVEIRGDERAQEIDKRIVPATEEDYKTEYLDLILSLKVVDSIDEAIAHINCYNTGHSEAIITDNYANAQKFLDEIDAAAVYVNASTRFTDGFEFGLGAEIGISTQKLHARGPMGLQALTSTKYIIYGNGQIRP
ncbi:MAG TPA: glutamate-5-semialdehyde dehydrogenase [Candidatus Scybalomonas excrementigallinarum]|nr:glutamate-5-semialdehyde dehydrogenase [Candidatus Scybalomonas excrementigallinarum]